LLTVVLLFVVSALANGAFPASSPSADAAAKECLNFFFRVTGITM